MKYVSLIWIWIFNCMDAYADIAQPRPQYEKHPLPKPDIPPYDSPWWMLWLTAPVFIIVLTWLWIKNSKSKQS